MNDLINIENKILVIRGQQVMLDRDLAELYGVETKRLNEAVKRNLDRFPEQFMFQLTKDEQDLIDNCLRSQIATLDNLKSQFATSNQRGKYSKYLPYAFSEQGVAMLSAVLRSETAVKVSIQIMNAFVAMRRFLLSNAQVFQRLYRIEAKQLETDHNIETIFTIMDKYKIENKQGIFVQGQIFDAYAAFQGLIQKAQKEIILIDNYIDLSVLERFSQKNPSKMHDRFLIIDNTEIYFIGASIKDLGKKCFGFMQLEDAQWMIKTVLSAL